jgi:hypothetical protein
MTIGARDTGRMRRVRTVLACTAVLVLGAGPAYAQSEGRFVDPESPSGKEYAIPLEGARRQADPRPVSPRSVASGADRATLFGDGVISPPAGSGTRKSGGSAPSGAGGDSAGQGTGSAGEPKPSVVRIAASQPGAPDSGLGTSVLILGIGLVVLLVGAGAGFVVRRRAG